MAVQIVTLPNPYMLSWPAWADYVAGYNPGLREQVDPSQPWQVFAQRLAEAVPEAPKPDIFKDWQDWAVALKLVLQL